MSDAEHAAAEITSRFAAGERLMAIGHATCRDLRAEMMQLMDGWSDLVAAGNHHEIERRAARLAELGRELLRLGG